MLQTRQLSSAVIRNMSQMKSAAILIIGDEVLNGKINDTNSRFFSKSLFSLGIEVRKILVVPDDQHDIIDAIHILKPYDFIVTSGGIGPTHDDITYESIARAYGLPLALHEETKEKMTRLSKKKYAEGSAEREAQLRMATLPHGEEVDVIFTKEDLWVPIVGIRKQVYILPGVPQLFESLLTSLLDKLDDRIVKQDEFIRFFVKTSMRESEIAPHLSQLQKEAKGVKIGSYPHMGQGFTTVSIVGKKEELDTMRATVEYCVKNLQGEEITAEEEQVFSDKVVKSVD